MVAGSKYVVKFRRRREKRTNYVKRLAYLKSGKPRFAVRLSNKNCLCQVIVYDEKGDRTVAQARSDELKGMGYKGNTGNIPAAYLTGLLCATRSAKKEAVLDIGLRIPMAGVRAFAALKGAVDGGIRINHGEVCPPDNRIFGAHTKTAGEAAVKEIAERIKTGKAKKVAVKKTEKKVEKKTEKKATKKAAKKVKPDGR